MRSLFPSSLAIALACASVDSSNADPILELRFADGSGNTSEFSRTRPDLTFRLCYYPMTPERSSSGLYSGGEARSAELSRAESAQLEAWAARVEDAVELQIDDRPKGSGVFTVRRAGGEIRITLRRSELLSAFDSFVGRLRERGAPGECSP